MNLLAIVSAVLMFITSCSNDPGETSNRGASGGHASPAVATDQSTTSPKDPDTAASREIGNRATGSGGTRYRGPGPEMADPNGATKAGSGPPKTR